MPHEDCTWLAKGQVPKVAIRERISRYGVENLYLGIYGTQKEQDLSEVIKDYKSFEPEDVLTAIDDVVNTPKGLKVGNVSRYLGVRRNDQTKDKLLEDSYADTENRLEAERYLALTEQFPGVPETNLLKYHSHCEKSLEDFERSVMEMEKQYREVGESTGVWDYDKLHKSYALAVKNKKDFLESVKPTGVPS